MRSTYSGATRSDPRDERYKASAMGQWSDVLHSSTSSRHGYKRFLGVNAGNGNGNGKPAGPADEPNAADVKVPEASTSEGCESRYEYVPGCDSQLG
jgi:hypothetical protein